jgi:signal transduction histidine kinase
MNLTEPVRPSHLVPPILLVDDRAEDLELVSLVLHGAFGSGAAERVSDAASFARHLGSRAFGLVLCEIDVAWCDGLQLLTTVRELQPEAALVVVTRLPVAEAAPVALEADADGFVSKDAGGLARLPQTVRNALLTATRRSRGPSASDRRLVDRLPLGVFRATADGVILDANPELARLAGAGHPSELSHRTMASLIASPEGRDRWAAALGQGGATEGFETDLGRPDGGRIRVRIRTWSLPARDGRATVDGLVEDVTELAALRFSADARTIEVEKARSDLEQMAFVVSHDLQQPLTVVARNLEMLEHLVGESMDDDATESLVHARRGAESLQRLLDAMRDYARIETRGQPTEAVDLGTVVDRVVDLLEDDRADVGAEITRDALPIVNADEAQMEQLFQNLLTNALKYRSERPPKIRIDCQDEGDRWRVRVADNGVGVDPTQADRVFRMFQRLHDDVPGTGIGLAVCRRIVERHQGRIGVEPARGGGSVFWLTLPKRAG